MIVVFISVYFTFNNFSQIKLLFGFILPVLIFILIVVFGENIDWNRMSSGRLTMWDAKINLLVDSTLNQVVFGKGLGSDYIKVEGWAGEKDSHNNYLQTITELGIIGLTLLIASIVSLYKLQPNVFGRGVVVAYAISGAVSNGVIYRLVPGYIFALLLAYIALKYTHSKSKIC
jgi:O-antigen ligase